MNEEAGSGKPTGIPAATMGQPNKRAKNVAAQADSPSPYTAEARAAVRAFLVRSLKYLAEQPFDSDFFDYFWLDERTRRDPETLIRISCEIVTDVCRLATEQPEFAAITEAMMMFDVSKRNPNHLALWKDKRWDQIARKFYNPPTLYVFTDKEAATQNVFDERYFRRLKLPIPGFPNVSACYQSYAFGNGDFGAIIEFSASTAQR
jgi:hypothetical protein